MPRYESTFIARHDMSTRQVESLAEDLTTIVKDNVGAIAGRGEHIDRDDIEPFVEQGHAGDVGDTAPFFKLQH